MHVRECYLVSMQRISQIWMIPPSIKILVVLFEALVTTLRYIIPESENKHFV